jgi:hypothetical protein
MIDEGLKTMNTSFLRGHVTQLVQCISQFALKPRKVRSRRKDGGGSKIKRLGWIST